ncbi:unnamed protein product [Rhodiola kirilowii]
MQVRRQLQEIKQGPNETMYEYLEKFNHLERSCCTLGLPEKLIIEYLLDGLRPLDKKLLDASAGGLVMNLPLSGIRELVTSVAENARFREETTRQEEFSRIKNVAQAEVPMSSLPEEMKQMKQMMIQLLRRQPAQMTPCEFCGGLDHKTDTCPTLMENDPEEVNAIGGYQGYNSSDRAGPSRQFRQAPGQNWPNDLRQFGQAPGQNLVIRQQRPEENATGRASTGSAILSTASPAIQPGRTRPISAEGTESVPGRSEPARPEQTARGNCEGPVQHGASIHGENRWSDSRLGQANVPAGHRGD